jgi:acid phosphatase
MRTIFSRALAAAVVLAAPAAFGQEAPKPVPGLEKINHIIVIFMENRSFDNLYGLFPGANGVAQAAAAAIQVDKSGVAYKTLPQAMNTNVRPAIPDTRFPPDLPNAPFRAEPYADIEQTTGDLTHRFYHEQHQIDGGKMDKFVAWSNAGALVMSHYDGSRLPLWEYAKNYVLMDNFFHGAFGGSFLNHYFLVCACIPEYKDAPAEIVAKLDENGMLVKDGAVTPEGYVVNTVQPVTGPKSTGPGAPPLIPLQDMTTIGDRLSEAGVSWAWYSGGWDDAAAGKADPLFQYHHQPFAFFMNTALGTDAAKAHLKDEADFIAGIHRGNLPQVVFYKPLGEENEHPGYSNVLEGEHHARELIRAIEKSDLWKDTLIVVTYDENGGLWDHVAPPKRDSFGPGTRIPALVIGPMAKKGLVDHTQYDTTSVLKLIETRFGLKPLNERDSAAADMTAALDLSADK